MTNGHKIFGIKVFQVLEFKIYSELTYFPNSIPTDV